MLQSSLVLYYSKTLNISPKFGKGDKDVLGGSGGLKRKVSNPCSSLSDPSYHLLSPPDPPSRESLVLWAA